MRDRFYKKDKQQRALLLLGASIFLTAFAAGVVGFFVSAYLLWQKRAELRLRHILFIGIALVFGTVGGLLCSNWIGLMGLYAVFLPVTLLYPALRNVMEKRTYVLLLRVFAVLGLANALIAYGQLYGFVLDIGSVYVHRLFGLFHNSNLFAHGLALTLLFVGQGVLTGADKKFNQLYLLSLSAMTLAAALTFCRTFWLALAVAALCYLLLAGYYRWFALAGAFTLCIVLLMVFGVPIVPRIDTITQEWTTRSQTYKDAFDALGASPLFGYGLYGFRLVPQHGNMLYIHAHNLYLNFIIDLGIPGALAFMGFVLGIAADALRCWKIYPLGRKYAALPLALIVYSLVHGLTDVTAYNVQNAYLFMLLTAGLLAVAKKESALNSAPGMAAKK